EHGLAERLGERRVRRRDERLAVALERQPAPRVDDVADAPAADLEGLAEVRRRGERTVAQHEDAEVAAARRAREEAPARLVRRRAQRPGAALPEGEQRRVDAARAQAREHPVESPALRDTAEVQRGAREELRAAACDAQAVAPDPRARRLERRRGGPLALR